MKWASAEKFQTFNSGMQVAEILNVARYLERIWEDRSLREQVHKHLQAIVSLSTKDFYFFSKTLEKVQNIYDYSAALTELEAHLDSSARDDEFLVTHRDRAKSDSPHDSKLVIVLENIRSAFNVGSIFRSADGFGAQKILLCGYTPTPTHEKVRQTAMGADELIPWSRFSDTAEALASLQDTKIIAVETAPKAPSLFDFRLPLRCALVFGNERYGLTQQSLNLVDSVVQIPLFGAKNSLNIGACMSIFSYEYRKQHSLEIQG